MSISFVDQTIYKNRVPIKELYGSVEAFQDGAGYHYIVTNERSNTSCTCLCVSGDCAGILSEFMLDTLVLPVTLTITREV